MDEQEEKNQQVIEISDLRVLEGIHNYLSKLISKYDRFKLLK